MKVFIFSLLIFIFSVGVFAQKYIEEKDILYDTINGKQLFMDMKTLDDGKKNKPCVIAIHGGGWAGGTRVDGMWMAEPVVNMGYTVFAIQYRLIGDAPFPAQIEDCKDAVRFIKANAKKYNINPNKIATFGGSAGGHLASLLGVLPRGVFEGNGANKNVSSEIRCAISYLGPEDMEFFLPLTSGAALRDDGFHWLFDKTKEGWDYWVPRSSPINYVTKDSKPHLLLYGSRDDLVYAAQGENFYRKMKEKGAYAEIYIEEGSWHGLTPEFTYPKIEKFLHNFLGKP